MPILVPFVRGLAEASGFACQEVHPFAPHEEVALALTQGQATAVTDGWLIGGADGTGGTIPSLVLLPEPGAQARLRTVLGDPVVFVYHNLQRLPGSKLNEMTFAGSPVGVPEAKPPYAPAPPPGWQQFGFEILAVSGDWADLIIETVDHRDQHDTWGTWWLGVHTLVRQRLMDLVIRRRPARRFDPASFYDAAVARGLADGAECGFLRTLLSQRLLLEVRDEYLRPFSGRVALSSGENLEIKPEDRGFKVLARDPAMQWNGTYRLRDRESLHLPWNDPAGELLIAGLYDDTIADHSQVFFRGKRIVNATYYRSSGHDVVSWSDAYNETRAQLQLSRTADGQPQLSGSYQRQDRTNSQGQIDPGLFILLEGRLQAGEYLTFSIADHVLSRLPFSHRAERSFLLPPAAPAHLAVQALFLADKDDPRSWFVGQTSQLPRFTEGNHVTPLVDGITAYEEMVRAMRTATGPEHAIRLAFYTCDRTFDLLVQRDGQGKVVESGGIPQMQPGTSAKAEFSRAAAAQAEVRVLGSIQGLSLARWHESKWNNELKVEGSNFHCRMVDHHLILRYGSHHQKTMVVHGGHGSVGFVGGIDINPQERSTSAHRSPGTWHDVHLKIEGPAVADLDRTFVERWKQAVPDSNLNVPAPAQGIGSCFVQITRTYVRNSGYHFLGKQPEYGTLFALRRAIQRAQRFIYIEDQYLTPYAGNLPFKASRDTTGIVGDLRDALRRISALIIVVPYTVSGQDQNRYRRAEFIGALREIAPEKIHTFWIKHPEQPEPADQFEARQQAALFVHSKLVLIDDVYAKVGSSNFCRRSFTYDSEADAHVIDGSLTEGSGTFVRDLRMRLWGEHLGIEPGSAAWPLLGDPDLALKLWDGPPPGARIRRFDAREPRPFDSSRVFIDLSGRPFAWMISFELHVPNTDWAWNTFIDPEDRPILAARTLPPPGSPGPVNVGALQLQRSMGPSPLPPAEILETAQPFLSSSPPRSLPAPAPLASTSGITFELWFWADDMMRDRRQLLLYSGTNTRVQAVWNNGQLSVGVQLIDVAPGTWVMATAAASSGTRSWRHLAGTFDGRNLFLYVDGRQEAAASIPAAPLTPRNYAAAPWSVGAASSLTQSAAFLGWMCGVRLWNRARSEEEVAGAFWIHLTALEEGLAAVWPTAVNPALRSDPVVSPVARPTGFELFQSGGWLHGDWLSPVPPVPHFVLGRSLLAFNGTNQYVQIDSGSKIGASPPQRTWELWFYPEAQSSPDPRQVLGGMHGSTQVFWTNGEIAVVMGPFRAAAAGYEPFHWYHVAAVHDGAQLHLYIQGQLAASVAAPGIPGASTYWRIGGGPTAGPPFRGLICEVRFWMRARTAEEILDTRDTHLRGDEDGLLLYFPLTEGGPGLVVLDRCRIPPMTAARLSTTDPLRQPMWVDAFSLGDPLADCRPRFAEDRSLALPHHESLADWSEGTLEFRASIAGLTAERTVLGREHGLAVVASPTALAVRVPHYDRARQEAGWVEVRTGRPGSWAHVAAVVTRSPGETPGQGSLAVYFDGYLVGTVALDLPLPYLPGTAGALGRWTFGGFDGLLGEVRLWNRPRSAAELQEDGASPLPGDADGLIGFWPLSRGEEEGLLDHGPLGLHAAPGGEGPVWVRPVVRQALG